MYSLINNTHPSTAEFLDDAVVRDGLTYQWKRLAPCAIILGAKLRCVNAP